MQKVTLKLFIIPKEKENSIFPQINVPSLKECFRFICMTIIDINLIIQS